MRTFRVLVALALALAGSLAAQAQPEPEPAPAQPSAPHSWRLSVASEGSLLERVKASAPQALSPGPTLPTRDDAGPRGSGLEPITVQFQFFHFGPALGASFKL